MKTIAIMLLSLALGQTPGIVGTVETTFDKQANFAAFHTYTWIAGYNAERDDAHKAIIAACEAEMTKLGFKKAAAGTPADVSLAYYTVKATYVDAKALDTPQPNGGNGGLPNAALGRLVVIMRRGASRTEQLWSASTREFVDPDPTKVTPTIQAATAKIFATYPGATPKKP